MPTKNKFKRNVAIGIAAAVVIGAIVMLRPRGEAGGSQAPRETAIVKRGELAITIETTGQFQTKKSVAVYPDTDWNASIMYLVEEGTQVKKGDVICRLDSPRVRSNSRDSEVELERNRASLAQAIEDKKIKEANAAQQVAAAELALQMAKLEKQQYGTVKLDEKGGLDSGAYSGEGAAEKGDAYQGFMDASLKIEKAKTDLDRAETDFKGMDKLLSSGYVTKTDYDAKELAVLEATRNLESQKLAYAILREYTYPAKLDALETTVKEAENNLAKARIQAEMDVARADVRIKSAELTFNRHKKEFDDMEKERAKLVITSPADGVITYGDPDQPWRRDRIAVGQQAWRQMRLFTIPDTSAYEVRTRVLEMDVFKAKAGQEAMITSPALPGAVLKATIRRIGEGESQDRHGDDKWKSYDVWMDLDATDSRIKAGMSCNIEIVLDRLRDVIFAPVTAVFNKGGKQVSYVVDGSTTREVQVETGESSEKFVVIRSGLSEGQQVVTAETTTGAKPESGQNGKGGQAS